MSLFVFLFSLCGCQNNIFVAGNTSGLVYFHYSCTDSFNEGSQSYTVKKEDDGTVRFCYKSFANEEGLEMIVDEELLDSLDRIYLDQKLAAWDGFHKTDNSIMDGESFSLTFGFADGTEQSASGSNSYPKGYSTFTAAIEALFTDYMKEMQKNNYCSE